MPQSSCSCEQCGRACLTAPERPAYRPDLYSFVHRVVNAVIGIVGGYGQGMTMRVPRSPEAGQTVAGGVLSIDHGGKGSNQAVAAARLGASVLLVSAIGDDAAGRTGRELWAAEGVQDRTTVIPGMSTMAGFIIVEPSGENRICIAPGALDRLRPDHVDAGLAGLTASDVVLVSLEIPLDAARRALGIGRERGAFIVLNPAPATPWARGLLAGADLITPNRSELAALAGRDEPATDEELSACIASLREVTGYRGGIVVTLGADGVLVDDGASTRLPAHPVDAVVDTTGAGDAFSAALAVALTEGRELRDAARFAAVAGALAVTREQVVPALPDRTTLDRLMSSTGAQTR